ncbi:conjugal transfer protein, partial [Helicobacter pylori]
MGTSRSGKEYVCVRRDKHKYQKSKDFMRLKRLLEQDEAMKAKRNNIHLIEDTTPQPKNAISITELLAQIKNQTPSKECRALNEEEVKTLEEVKNIIKAPKPLQKDLKKNAKKHTIKTQFCAPIPYIERLKTTDDLKKNKKGLDNIKKQNQANPIKE